MPDTVHTNMFIYKALNSRTIQCLLIYKGFGGSISGHDFSRIHGDLHTSLTKKPQVTLDRLGLDLVYTNSGTVNTWVNTIHIHINIRMALRKQLHIKTSSKHKELTPGEKKIHATHVKSLKHQLLGYGVDPFSNQAPKCFLHWGRNGTYCIQRYD